MTEKKSFVMYYDFWEQLEFLSCEQRGELITAVYEYVRNGEVESAISPIAKAVFLGVKQALDRDARAYEETCKRNKENGKHGGRPKKQEPSNGDATVEASQSKNRAVFSETQKTEGLFSKPKKPDNENDNENDNDNVNVNGNGNGNENENNNDNDNGNGVWEAEHIVLDSEAVSNGLSETFSEEISDPISDFAPLTEEDREVLLKKGIPSAYVAEREERAADYAREHGDTALNVLISWWQSDRLSPKYAERQRADFHTAPRASPRTPFVSDRIGEKDRKGNSVGDRSFDVNDFFAMAVARTFRD